MLYRVKYALTSILAKESSVCPLLETLMTKFRSSGFWGGTAVITKSVAALPPYDRRKSRPDRREGYGAGFDDP
jgi:hypothetical protein